jgi:hypothetical protein
MNVYILSSLSGKTVFYALAGANQILAGYSTPQFYFIRKSWLITSETLYCRNFNILYQFTNISLLHMCFFSKYPLVFLSMQGYYKPNNRKTSNAKAQRQKSCAFSVAAETAKS